MKYDIFTDGCCIPNPGAGGYCAIIVQKKVKQNMICGRKVLTTNNEMELVAILEGLKSIPTNSTAVVYTDSDLAVNWLMGSYRTKIDHIRQTVFSIERVIAKKKLKVRFNHVPAHSGLEFNELADKYANEEARKIAAVKWGGY